MRRDFRHWLQAQPYSSNSIASRVSNTARLEQAYGDLDEHFDRDQFSGIAATLAYSTADARRGLPNPSRCPVDGDVYNSLASLRSALALYGRFRDETSDGIAPFTPSDAAARSRAIEPGGAKFGLEYDLQAALRREITQLEDGLQVDDRGLERRVPSGFIDITARDRTGGLVVIELKATTADRSAVGQILSYMGDLADEEGAPVRGILVAHDFDGKARAAARMVPDLMLRSYAVRFTFTDAARSTTDG